MCAYLGQFISNAHAGSISASITFDRRGMWGMVIAFVFLSINKSNSRIKGGKLQIHAPIGGAIMDGQILKRFL